MINEQQFVVPTRRPQAVTLNRENRFPPRPHIHFQPVTPDWIDRASAFAISAVPVEIQAWIRASLTEHHLAMTHGLDDGRRLFLLTLDDEVHGLCGTHHYSWGPSDACWASWFIVHPRRRHTKTPLRLAKFLLDFAKSRGYRRLYVETYRPDERYATIAKMLPRCGFQLQATLPDYFGNDVDALIFMLDLTKSSALDRFEP